MSYIEETERPSKKEQKTALKSYDALSQLLKEIQTEYPTVEIEETKERIIIPLSALKLLAKILKETSKGRPISIVPIETEITTQAAADILGYSRPHIVKLLDQGKISFTRIGKHRRIKYQDVINFKKQMKAEQRQLLIELMTADEEDGLYDS